MEMLNLVSFFLPSSWLIRLQAFDIPAPPEATGFALTGYYPIRLPWDSAPKRPYFRRELTDFFLAFVQLRIAPQNPKTPALIPELI